jgi:Domain of unknown function (DUF4918)
MVPYPKNTEAGRIIAFLTTLKPDFQLPPGVEIMNPFLDKQSLTLAKLFYLKYYSDNHRRHFIFGINPGRWGAGITGIPFTDPQKLRYSCGIDNDLSQKQELSANFIYTMIENFGGVKTFYKKFFITAVCPLGFTKNGKNLNYYDDRNLQNAAEPFIIDCLERQLFLLKSEDTCFCLGEGDNFRYLKRLNEQYTFFKKIIPMPHPRWIMQYRRKQLDEYLNLYVKVLSHPEEYSFK